jgi:hypothetical protein
LGVATTIPAPGNGTGWIYFVSMLRAGLAANAWRTVHGRAKLALAPVLYFRKFRLVILLIVSLLFHCANASRSITLTGALFLVILEIMKNLSPKGVWRKMEREGYAFLR